MSRRDDIYSGNPNGNGQRRPAQRPANGHGRLSYEDQMRSHGQSAQRQRSAGPSARDYSRDRYTSGQRQGTRMQQPSGRRQVQLDQSSQVARRPQQDQRARQQAPQRVANPNMAGRYSRGNGVYQARPNQAATVARAAEGVLSSPVSFIVRIALIVVLAAVFGVRMVLSSGDTAQLRDLEATVASQQEQLDTLSAENQSMQESIDSRQATLDAYNALL
ncbi:MAG: hypothetical protein ACI36W_01730 [Coriobacteriales bacterium]